MKNNLAISVALTPPQGILNKLRDLREQLNHNIVNIDDGFKGKDFIKIPERLRYRLLISSIGWTKNTVYFEMKDLIIS